MLKRWFIIITLVVIASCANISPQNESPAYHQGHTLKPYDDVLAELEIAISEHNFRITGHSHVGKVIRERGTPNFPNYDTFQFCNLTHAKTLLEMSPHAIQYMPCTVVTYEYQGKTIVKTRLLPINSDNKKFNAFTKKMNNQLKAIVDFALEE